ncbi:unnamed protein product [Lampetra fluviatilis]
MGHFARAPGSTWTQNDTGNASAVPGARGPRPRAVASDEQAPESESAPGCPWLRLIAIPESTVQTPNNPKQNISMALARTAWLHAHRIVCGPLVNGGGHDGTRGESGAVAPWLGIVNNAKARGTRRLGRHDKRSLHCSGPRAIGGVMAPS